MMENVMRLTQLTGYPRPTLGTLALARHGVTHGPAAADAALQAVRTIPSRRTGCQGEVGQKPSIKKSRSRT